MNSRVRYIDDNGLLKSKTFDADEGKRLSVEIDTKNFTYVIVNVNSGLPIREGGENTILKIKKVVKIALQDYGVLFEPEYRVYGNEETTINVAPVAMSEVV